MSHDTAGQSIQNLGTDPRFHIVIILTWYHCTKSLCPRTIPTMATYQIVVRDQDGIWNGSSIAFSGTVQGYDMLVPYLDVTFWYRTVI